jgi:Bacterial protein of unknown function (Gcw_chp)
MSDYNFRGITLSNHRPALEAYFMPQYNVSTALQLYVGVDAANISAPNRAAAQLVYFFGSKVNFKPFSFDLGGSYVDYPGGMLFDGQGSPATCTNGIFFLGQCNTSKAVANYWEFYVKSTLAIDDTLLVSTNAYYSPSWVNTGATGTYLSFGPKANLPKSMLGPEVIGSVTAEIGHYWFGTTDAFYGVPAFPTGIKLPNYTTWNFGIDITYRSMTLDLRYYDSDLSKANCNILTSDYTARFGGSGAVTPTNPSGLISNWCGTSFAAKLSFDTTVTNTR